MTDRRISVAILGCRGFPSTYSGYETFVGELAPRLARQGHAVTVYCRKSLFRERPAILQGVRLRYLPSIETKNLGTLTHTFCAVADALVRPFDVLFFVNPGTGFHCILPRLLGRKIAINVDGLEWTRGKWGRVARGYFKTAARAATAVCQEIVNDSREMQRIYAEEFDTPSEYIAYGAYIEGSRDPSLIERFGLRPREYYLIASRLIPENHPELIAEAFSRVRSGKVLAIAGGANYSSPLVRRLSSFPDRRVRMLGHIDSVEAIQELHCNCYAYIHGHSVGGTNPSLLKALGFGNCILALDVPFNREVLLDYGLYFRADAEDLRAKIQRLDDRPDEAESFRRRAPERIREAFTWEMIADRYQELFLRLADAAYPPPRWRRLLPPRAAGAARG